MDFDPDAYLAATATKEPPKGFDPDEYLRQTEPKAPAFDPDAYLAATAPKAAPVSAPPLAPAPAGGTGDASLPGPSGDEVAAATEAAKASIFGPGSIVGGTLLANQMFTEGKERDTQEAKDILAKIQAPRLEREAMIKTARETGQPVIMVDGKPTLGPKPTEAPLSTGNQVVQGIERGLGGGLLRVAEGVARLTGARKTADSLGSDVARMDSVLPEQTTAGKVGSGVGGALALLSGGGLPGALGIAGTQAIAGGYDAAYANAKDVGASEDIARAAAQQGAFKSALKTVPELAAYWLLGAGAAKAVAPLLTQAAPVTKAIVGGAAATAANVATSTALHGIHGEPLITPEGLATDATFGFLAHGLAVGGEAVKHDAQVRELLKSAPQESLEAAAADPKFRETSPYSPALIDAELARRQTIAPVTEAAGALKAAADAASPSLPLAAQEAARLAALVEERAAQHSQPVATVETPAEAQIAGAGKASPAEEAIKQTEVAPAGDSTKSADELLAAAHDDLSAPSDQPIAERLAARANAAKAVASTLKPGDVVVMSDGTRRTVKDVSTKRADKIGDPGEALVTFDDESFITGNDLAPELIPDRNDGSHGTIERGATAPASEAPPAEPIREPAPPATEPLKESSPAIGEDTAAGVSLGEDTKVGGVESTAPVEVAEIPKAEPVVAESATAEPSAKAEELVPEPKTEAALSGGEPPAEPPKTAAAAPEQPAGDTTAAYNAETDRILKEGGFEPIEAPARKALPDSWDESLAEVKADPSKGSRLVEELNENPRTLKDDVESGVLLHELANRKAEQAAAQSALFKAVESGDEAAVGDARSRLEDARTATFEAVTAAKLTGTAWGRSGRFRQISIDQDFSLAAMETAWRAEVNAGKPLTGDQAKMIAELHAKIAESDAKIAAFEAKEAEVEAKRVFDQVLQEAKKEAKASAASTSRVSTFLEHQAAKARERIIARRGKLFATIDPLNVAGLVDEAIIGADHLAKGLTKLADWSAAMIKDFGERIRPVLPAIYEKAREYHDTIAEQIAAKTGSKAAPVRTPAEVLAADRSGAPVDPKLVFDLARSHVRAGVTGMENVMKAVHADLLPNHEGLTEREVRDAFSGYGKTSIPSREADLTALREYKTLARLTSQLEDAQRKIAPLKTGPQRDKLSQEARDLTRQVRETMRRLGIETTTPEQQLKTSLDAVKTRLRNSIEDLTRQIETRTKPEGKTQIPYDAEATALRAERDRLAGIVEEIFGKPELTDAQRIAAATKSLDRSIAEEDAMLKAGILKRPARESKTPLTPELEAKRAMLDSMRALRKELADAAAPKRTPEQIQLARDKKLIAARTAELNRRVRVNDYAPRPKREPLMDAEKTALLFENQKAKDAFLRGKFEETLKNRTWDKKTIDAVGETLGLLRSIKTAYDLSAPLRQGLLLSASHPILAAKALPPMIRAFGITPGSSLAAARAAGREVMKGNPFRAAVEAAKTIREHGEQVQFAVNNEIQNRRNAKNGYYEQAKLNFSDQNAVSLSKMEEAFASRWGKYVPGVDGSGRAYSTFLNRLRADTFDSMLASLENDGNGTAARRKAIAEFVNIASGRGDFGKLQPALTLLNKLYFAPRFALSRFQVLYGHSLWKAILNKDSATTRLIATEYARTLVGLSVVYGLLTLMQDKKDPMLGLNPLQKSTFGTVRFGDTRVDLLGGLKQAAVFSAQLLTGKKKTAAGKTVDLTDSKSPTDGDLGDVVGAFNRTKLNPFLGALWNLRSGRNMAGEKTQILPSGNLLDGTFRPGEVLDMPLPMSVSATYEILRDQGMAKGIPLSILNVLGASVQSYSDTRKKR